MEPAVTEVPLWLICLIGLPIIFVVYWGIVLCNLEQHPNSAESDSNDSSKIIRASDEFMNVLLMGEFIRFIHFQLARDYEDQYCKETLIVSWMRETEESKLKPTSEIHALLPYGPLFTADVTWIDTIKTLSVTIEQYNTILEMTLWTNDIIYQYPMSNDYVSADN